MKLWYCLVCVALLPCLPVSADTVPTLRVQAETWTERKCALYTDAWNHLVGGGTPAGVSARFMAEHAAFLASGCLKGTVCAESRQEVALADTLSLMAVAEGMAGSFLPFNCQD